MQVRYILLNAFKVKLQLWNCKQILNVYFFIQIMPRDQRIIQNKLKTRARINRKIV